MRSIEEIKKDIAFYEAKMLKYENLKFLPHYYPGYIDAELSKRDLEEELRLTLTADIPLDRLEAICQAERDGRVVVLEKPLTVEDLKTIEAVGRIVLNAENMSRLLTARPNRHGQN